jgi:hypothetical protein
LPEERKQAAREIIENANSYYTGRAQHRHIGIEREWIERVLIEPHHTEIEPNGRTRYWGYIAGWGVEGRWLRVLADNGRLFNDFPDRNKGNSMKGKKSEPVILNDLDIFYDSETDTLDIGNGLPACFGEDVAENLTAHTSEEGEVVFFVLSHASEVLLPHLYDAMKARLKE